MKTATESIRDLENIIADLRNQLSDAGKRTDRLREERDSKSLFLREARAELDKVRGERDEAKKTAKLEMIAKLKRWIGPVGNPDYYKAQAQLLELESRASSLEAALRYLLEVRGIKCEHKHPGPDEFCANCRALAALPAAPAHEEERNG